MNYYMLRIKCGKKGDDDPDKIRNFITKYFGFS